MVDDERRRLLERLYELEQRSAEFRIELAKLKADLIHLGFEVGGKAAAATEPGRGEGEPPEAVAPAADVTDEADRSRRHLDLEVWLGGRGLLLLGVLALVFAVGFIVKYSIDQGWIGPTVRVLLGAALGIAAVIAGERIRAVGYRTYGLWLAAGGFAAIYISIWAAAALYAIVTAPFGFALLVILVAAAAGLGLLRGAEGFVALALFGGYLAPLVVRIEAGSILFALAYLASLSGAGLGVARAGEWPRLAALAVAGGTLMTLADPAGSPHLHGVYLVALVAATLVVARRQLWSAVALLTVVLAWLAFAFGSQAWELEGLVMAAYAGGLWLACLIGSVGVPGWAEASAEDSSEGEAATVADMDADDLVGLAILALPAFFLYLAVWIGVGDSALREWRGPTCAALSLGLGAFYLVVGTYDLTAKEITRSPRLALGYLFLLLAPVAQWSDIELVRAWLFEGLILTAAGITFRTVEARAAALAAFVLAVLLFLDGLRGRPDADAAFLSGWALTGLATSLGPAFWALAQGRLEAPASWETGLRPVAFLVTAVLFLSWGTGEIGRFYDLLGDAARWRLARELSISAFWMAYAASLLFAGFRREQVYVRRAGLAMAFIAAGKVFLYDLANLSQLYRIGSFILLAAVLLALSFGYQRLTSGEG